MNTKISRTESTIELLRHLELFKGCNDWYTSIIKREIDDTFTQK